MTGLEYGRAANIKGGHGLARWVVFAVWLAAGLLFLGLAAERKWPHPDPKVGTMLDECRAALIKLNDAVYTLHRKEWKDGVYLPEEEILVKYRRPEALYMRWIGEYHKGRELLYRSGWNEGRLRVNPGRLLPNLDLDPYDSWAMKESRQPVWMASIVRVGERIINDDDWLNDPSTPSAVYRYLGEQTLRGVPSVCYQADLPKKVAPRLYADRVEICFDRVTKLPSGSKAWDRLESGALRLVETYTFTKMKVNSGLTDADFDPENEAYGF